MTSVLRILAFASVLSVTAGCSRSVSPLAVTETLPAGHRLVTGNVWIFGASGATPAASGSVFGWTEDNGGSRTTKAVPIGPDGRYQFSAPQGATVHMTGGSYQPCAARAIIAGDATLDVHLVTDLNLLGANLPAALVSQRPTLSGTVYELTAEGRLPLRNAAVQLTTSTGVGIVVANTRTDIEGRYLLCSVPQSSGFTLLASLTGFLNFRSADLSALTTFDLELRRNGVD